MTNPTPSHPQLYALLIGVDYYTGNEAPDGAVYESLNGCVNDVLGVQKLLQQRLKLDDARLFKLTATNLGLGVKEKPDAQPTRKNIIAAFDTLTNTAQAGDQIYIHYAGHGGRAVTIY
ncbi:MAG: caspase family protein, partial [Anaerolineales bacterium]|nr:caspase family protein [Anaerolineales bacterium]